ncbi:hypothetical protein [Luteibacter aegosomatissinici]|uniref:hypothetical protein n=1 Tax=Luteibacter aegosomatissinici TaxID=2911539 RepID=UPI001FFA239F|nr:hypothetical protein [Luteibacter aegosomatissinici]UPG96499.1 hypothetical protein L2Y97_10405 [Luteibacter aegosomatissinici]
MVVVYLELHSPSVASTTRKGVHSTWVSFDGQVTSEEVWSESLGAQLEQWSVEFHAATGNANPNASGMSIEPDDGVGKVSVAIDPALFQRLLFAQEDDVATLTLTFDNASVLSLDDDKLTWRDQAGASVAPDEIAIQFHPGGLDAEDDDEDEDEEDEG